MQQVAWRGCFAIVVKELRMVPPRPTVEFKLLIWKRDRFSSGAAGLEKAVACMADYAFAILSPI
jgi:hypothetical protein